MPAAVVSFSCPSSEVMSISLGVLAGSTLNVFRRLAPAPVRGPGGHFVVLDHESHAFGVCVVFPPLLALGLGLDHLPLSLQLLHFVGHWVGSASRSPGEDEEGNQRETGHVHSPKG